MVVATILRGESGIANQRMGELSAEWSDGVCVGRVVVVVGGGVFGGQCAVPQSCSSRWSLCFGVIVAMMSMVMVVVVVVVVAMGGVDGGFMAVVRCFGVAFTSRYAVVWCFVGSNDGEGNVGYGGVVVLMVAVVVDIVHEMVAMVMVICWWRGSIEVVVDMTQRFVDLRW
ncbi:Hypothetical predicted protein [Olea europaea subsp. europaea]|uniref:Transmembrane protein n=1 Tax=Olea europaea subsp. europaea TaxID=158383 RepID=A0A8S0TMD7_OLEEU|nr:Hypothetical predicted protein [Olea europaea subsp. europaea]